MKKNWIRAAVSLLLAAALALPLTGGAAEGESKLCFRMIGTLIKEADNAGLFASPDTSGPPRSRFGRNEPCQIIGQGGNCYRAIVNGEEGFVAKSRLDLSGEIAEDLPEELQPLRLEDAIPYLDNKIKLNLEGIKYLNLLGTIQVEEPLDSLYIFVWDQRQGKVETAFFQGYDTPVTTISASSLRRLMTTENITAGEKTLVVEAGRNGQMTVLFRSPLYIRGRFQEVKHATKKCTLSNENVLDYELDYAWTPTAFRPGLTVEIPSSVYAAGMTVEWKTLPDGFTVELYGPANELISSAEYETGFYMDWIGLTREVRRAVITPNGEGAAISALRVYEEGYPRDLVQRWQPMPEKVDLMLVSTHQDDEWLFFGGTVPYYAAQGKDIAVVYMANCGRDRYREALDGMWTAGLRTHPIFFGLRDILVDTVELSRKLWEDKEPEKLLVRAIRRYRPEVLLAQDFHGEYGHPQHVVTAELAAQALELAADPAYDPESAAEFGVWQIKKLYIHLYEENQIVMDWDVPLDETGVITPDFLAKRAFDKNRSQQGYFTMEEFGTVYDNRLFGLYYSAVGPDVAKNDFFEHIPAD